MKNYSILEKENIRDVSDDTKVLERICKIRELNSINKEYKNKDLYRLLLKPGIYISAYGKIKSNKGALTPAADNDTLDGINLDIINRLIIQKLQDESYQPKLARLEMIPKRDPTKFRPLGIQNPYDKLIQECIRMILDSIFDSSFSENSHGFRQDRGCLTAINQIRRNFDGCNFIIEGDIESCFPSIDHNILISILRKRISDERFLNLIRKFLVAGYLVNTPGKKSFISFPDLGTPQGSIISPILCNIYMNEFDIYMDSIISKYSIERSEQKKHPASSKLRYKKKKITQKLKEEEETTSKEEKKKLLKELTHTSLELIKRPYYLNSHINIYYVRYADDWIIGINGPKNLATKIKDEIEIFLFTNLKLKLSKSKTKITDITDGRNYVLFLGYNITLQKQGKITKMIHHTSKKPYYKGTTGHKIKLLVPKDRLLNSLKNKGFCDHKFFPIALKKFANFDDKLIVQRFNSVRIGLMNFYCLVDDSNPFWQIDYIIRYSCAKTLAQKHKTSISKIFKKHGITLKVVVEKEILKTNQEEKIIKTFSSEMKKFVTFKPILKEPSLKPFEIFKLYNQFTNSGLFECCCICNSNIKVEMHHIKKVSISRDSSKTINMKELTFSQISGRLKRKQIPVCQKCHNEIHNGNYDGTKLSNLIYFKDS